MRGSRRERTFAILLGVAATFGVRCGQRSASVAVGLASAELGAQLVEERYQRGAGRSEQGVSQGPFQRARWCRVSTWTNSL